MKLKIDNITREMRDGTDAFVCRTNDPMEVIAVAVESIKSLRNGQTKEMKARELCEVWLDNKNHEQPS